jgi:hypothetical protein
MTIEWPNRKGLLQPEAVATVSYPFPAAGIYTRWPFERPSDDNEEFDEA